MTVTNLAELKENWPQDESGRVCKELVVSYLSEKLFSTASSNDCNAVSSQGEAAADKVFASLVREFRTIGTADKPMRAPTIRPLNRNIDPAKLAQEEKTL